MSISLLTALSVSSAFAQETDNKINIYSEAAMVINASDGEVIYQKNPDKIIPTASLTKVMTLLIASEEFKKGTIHPKDETTISDKAWKTYGSRMWLEVGRKVSLENLFKGIAVISGNDAAVSMAEHISGSTDEFVKKMNMRAKELNMIHTQFLTPNGFPSSNKDIDVSTARDLSLLSREYVTQFPENLKIHSMKTFAFDNGRNTIEQQNHNPLLGKYQGADGLKTGMLDHTYNLIGTAKRGDLRLIVVTLKAKTDAQREADAIHLLDYGFSQYKTIEFGKKGDIIDTVKVFKSSNKRKVDVALNKNLSLVLLNSKENEVKVKDNFPRELVGEYKKGEKIGTRTVSLGNKKVIADIVVTENIKKAGMIRSFFDGLALYFDRLLDKLLD